jgi:carbon monoxide dehydrogenase subunit G
MTSQSIVLSRSVNAPPEKVWAVIVDIENAATTLSGVDEVEVLGSGPYAVGTRWRETRTMFGTKATEEMWVTAVDAPHRTVVEAESAGAHYTTVFTIEPVGAGSRLNMEFSGGPVKDSRWHALIWRTVGKFGMSAAAKTMRSDLDDIARAAERV